MKKPVKVNASKKIEQKTWKRLKKTAVVLFSDGTIKYGFGFGQDGITKGEICFNTSITGYQEIMTDPSYSNQIINFTFPHIGNVGTNIEDYETANPNGKIHVAGIIVHSPITLPSNYRSKLSLSEWMDKNHITGAYGIDTRYVTKRIRDYGMMNCIVQYHKKGDFDLDFLKKELNNIERMEGLDLASQASTTKDYIDNKKSWEWQEGYNINTERNFKIAIVDYGIKSNIIRMLNSLNCETKVFPAKTNISQITEYQPDGILLSNGPGDPLATAGYSVNLIKSLINLDIPIFGICFGHQVLALALGAETKKMSFGHHGANHPVLNINTNKVAITSMNHGFTVNSSTLPGNVKETHVSLFDGSNCGIKVIDKPIFSVQFHPEASPGPLDSGELFDMFIENIRLSQKKLKN
tara:strand:- start:25348 stop:26571 length:1224 start_codon:yes stop_codon:yes gene_type:complete